MHGRDIPNGVSRQFYSPAASDIAHNCIVHSDIRLTSSGIRPLTCERCELYGRIEYH